MDLRERLGRNVRELREEKGLSQEEFGFAADSYRTYVSEIERGLRNPTVIVLERYAHVLGVTPGTLLDRQPAKRAKR